MLLRPPSINEGAEDNLSHVITQSDARQSSRSRNKIKKKQNSLSFRNKPLNSSRENQQGDKQLVIQRQREGDNGSVHSYASGKSKQKKKQSSIGVKKNRGAFLTVNSPNKKSEEDQLQVLDYATNRQVDTGKQYQIQRSEVKQDFAIAGNNYSPNVYDRKINQPQDKKYNSFKDAIAEPQFISKPKSRQQIDDEIPVVKLVEQRNKYQPNFKSNPFNAVSPRVAQKKQTKKLGQLFEQNRRNAQNSSELAVSASQINGSSVIGGQSRRSRSKLGQLFKDKSRQKQISNTSQLSYTQNASSNFNESINNSNLNRNLANDLTGNNIHVLGGGGNRSREKQQIKRAHIPEKVLQESVHQFQTGDDGHNQSELNLSLSRNSPFVSKLEVNPVNNKDSLCFNIEPQKKKRGGLGVTTKNSKVEDEIIKISGNLVSKELDLPRNQYTNPFMGLQPEKQRQADPHERLKQNFKQNQKYLMESGVNINSFNNHNQMSEQAQRKQQALKNKQLQLQRERQMMAQRNRLEQTRLDQQREAQRRKQEQLRQQQQLLKRQQEKRRVEAKKQQQQRKRQQQKKQHDRIKQEQNKAKFKREQLEFEQRRQAQAQRQREKQIQLQKQSQRQRQQEQRLKQQREHQKRMDRQKQQKERQQKILEQAERKRQQQRALEQRQAQQEKARLKKNYEKQKQRQNPKNPATQLSQKQSSLIYELQNDLMASQKQQVKIALDNLPSSYSRDHSSRGSEKSQQSRKSTRKKEGVIARNNNRHILGEASPRAEQSFYEQPSQAQKPNKKIPQISNQAEPPRKLMSFSEEQDLNYEAKPQSKTDSYFYDKSSKAYSKPPLSKKSSSKSKPKESSINKKSSKDSQIKINTTGQPKPADKKLSLVELAMKKNYEPESGSQYQSQDSFRSRQNSSASRNSRNSGTSKGSKKKQSVIKLKQNSINSYNKPPLYRKTSSQNQDSLANHPSRYDQQMHRTHNQRSHFQDIMDKQGKPIVVKGCTFIDQRGRLIENGNMVVRGSQVTGYNSNSKNSTGLTEKKFIQRLMNSRERRRSISRERSLKGSRASDRSRSRQRQRQSTNGFNNDKYFESEAYSESEDKRASGSNFYGTRNDQSFYQNYTGSRTNFGNTTNYKNGTPQNLQQFVRPIQQAGIQQQQQQQEIRKDSSNKNQKRTMQRTQKGSRGNY